MALGLIYWRQGTSTTFRIVMFTLVLTNYGVLCALLATTIYMTNREVYFPVVAMLAAIGFLVVGALTYYLVKAVSSPLQEKELLYQTVVENSFDLISIIDVSARHVYVNPLWQQVLGHNPETLGDPMQYIHPEDQPRALEVFQQLQRGDEVSNFEIRFQAAEGHYVPIECSLRGIKVEGERLTMVASRDITQKKQAEAQLKQLKLQEERYQRMLGHFLKNDLHKIVLSLEYLQIQHGLSQDATQDLNEVLALVTGSSKTITTVNKIFTMLQAPLEKYDQEYNLLELVEDLVAQLQDQVPTPFSIRVDRESLDVNLSCHPYTRDAFLELLTFSVRAAMNRKVGDDIIIQARHMPQGFCVSIQDSFSPPIPRDVCTRLESPITDQWEAQGLFVGLALVSVVMRHCRGQLTIQPGEPRGNAFQLVFPLNLLRT